MSQPLGQAGQQGEEEADQDGPEEEALSQQDQDLRQVVPAHGPLQGSNQGTAA